MKKILLTISAMLMFGLFSQEVRVQNPILEKYPDSMTFYVSFDRECPDADVSSGNGTPTRSEGNPTYSKGLFGKALVNGRIFYRGKENIDLSGSGTLFIWVSPIKQLATVPADRKEPAFIAVALSAFGKYALFIGKVGGQPWGRGHMNSYVQYFGKKHVNCCIYDSMKTEDWKPGDWKLLTVVWKPGSIASSVNGGKMAYSNLNTPMTEPGDEIRIGTAGTEGPWQIAVDEAIVLKKALNEEEIKAVYDAAIKVSKGE